MSAQELEPYFQASAARNGVDVRLLRTVAWIESSYKRRATSYKNGKPCAYGLMQLIPATAARFGVTDVFDPAQNIEGGARYLRVLLEMFGGDVSLALAGYNAGEGAVLKYGRRVPPYPETINYVAKGRSLLARAGLPGAAYVQATARITTPQIAAKQPAPAAPAAPPETLPAAPPPRVTTSFIRRVGGTPPAPPAEAVVAPSRDQSVQSFVRRNPTQ